MPRSFYVKVTGSGRPVIFIPTFACSGKVWEGTVAHLGPHVQAHVLTLAGFAGRPPSGESPLLDHVRDDLVRYIRDRKLVKPVIVGHGLGGFLAYELAATEPYLLGGALVIDGLPFFGGFGADFPANELKVRAQILHDQVAGFGQREFQGWLVGVYESMFSTAALRDATLELATESTPGAVADVLFTLLTTDLRPTLPGITVPFVIIASDGVSLKEQGDVDATWHQQVGSLPRHTLTIYRGVRHFVQLEEPARFQAALDAFLATIPM